MPLYLSSHYGVVEAMERMEEHSYTPQICSCTLWLFSVPIDGSPVDVLLSGQLLCESRCGVGGDSGTRLPSGSTGREDTAWKCSAVVIDHEMDQ